MVHVRRIIQKKGEVRPKTKDISRNKNKTNRERQVAKLLRQAHGVRPVCRLKNRRNTHTSE